MDLETWISTFNVLRDNCIENVRILRGTGIQVGNPNTYGEITPKFVHQILTEVTIKPDDIFYDIGSGIGNVVLQVAAQIGCQCHGIEVRPELTEIADKMRIELEQVMIEKNLFPVDIHFHTGDALSEEFDLQDATIVFLNNWCFGGELEHDLFVKFEKMLRNGTKIICLKDAFPRFRPNSLRCKDHPCQRFRYPWRKFQSCEDAISWDSRLVECVVYQIVDYGCTLEQANRLINTITISEKNSLETPNERPLFVDEAKFFMKRLLTESFIATTPSISSLLQENGIIENNINSSTTTPPSSSIEEEKDYNVITLENGNNIIIQDSSDIDTLTKKMKQQRFFSSNPRDVSDVLVLPTTKTKKQRRFSGPKPRLIKFNLASAECILDNNKDTIQVLPKITNYNPSYLSNSKLFLKRNFKNCLNRPPIPKLFFIQRRPFAPPNERDEAIFVLLEKPKNGYLKPGLVPGSAHKQKSPSKRLQIAANRNSDTINSLPLDFPWFNSVGQYSDEFTFDDNGYISIDNRISKRRRSDNEIEKLFPKGQFLPVDPPKLVARKSNSNNNNISIGENSSNNIIDKSISPNSRSSQRKSDRSIDKLFPPGQYLPVDPPRILSKNNPKYNQQYQRDKILNSKQQQQQHRNNNIINNEIIVNRSIRDRKSNSSENSFRELFPPGQYLPVDPPRVIRRQISTNRVISPNNNNNSKAGRPRGRPSRKRRNSVTRSQSRPVSTNRNRIQQQQRRRSSNEYKTFDYSPPPLRTRAQSKTSPEEEIDKLFPKGQFLPVDPPRLKPRSRRTHSFDNNMGLIEREFSSLEISHVSESLDEEEMEDNSKQLYGTQNSLDDLSLDSTTSNDMENTVVHQLSSYSKSDSSFEYDDDDEEGSSPTDIESSPIMYDHYSTENQQVDDDFIIEKDSMSDISYSDAGSESIDKSNEYYDFERDNPQRIITTSSAPSSPQHNVYSSSSSRLMKTRHIVFPEQPSEVFSEEMLARNKQPNFQFHQDSSFSYLSHNLYPVVPTLSQLSSSQISDNISSLSNPSSNLLLPSTNNITLPSHQTSQLNDIDNQTSSISTNEFTLRNGLYNDFSNNGLNSILTTKIDDDNTSPKKDNMYDNDEDSSTECSPMGDNITIGDRNNDGTPTYSPPVQTLPFETLPSLVPTPIPIPSSLSYINHDNESSSLYEEIEEDEREQVVQYEEDEFSSISNNTTTTSKKLPTRGKRHLNNEKEEIDKLFPKGQFLPVDPPRLKPRVKSKPKSNTSTISSSNPSTSTNTPGRKRKRSRKQAKPKRSTDVNRTPRQPRKEPKQRYCEIAPPTVHQLENPIEVLFPPGQFLPLDPPRLKPRTKLKSNTSIISSNEIVTPSIPEIKSKPTLRSRVSLNNNNYATTSTTMIETKKDLIDDSPLTKLHDSFCFDDMTSSDESDTNNMAIDNPNFDNLSEIDDDDDIDDVDISPVISNDLPEISDNDIHTLPGRKRKNYSPRNELSPIKKYPRRDNARSPQTILSFEKEESSDKILNNTKYDIQKPQRKRYCEIAPPTIHELENPIEVLFPPGQFLPLDPPRIKAKPRPNVKTSSNESTKSTESIGDNQQSKTRRRRKSKKNRGTSTQIVNDTNKIAQLRKRIRKPSPWDTIGEITQDILFPKGQFLPIDPPRLKPRVLKKVTLGNPLTLSQHELNSSKEDGQSSVEEVETTESSTSVLLEQEPDIFNEIITTLIVPPQQKIDVPNGRIKNHIKNGSSSIRAIAKEKRVIKNDDLNSSTNRRLSNPPFLKRTRKFGVPRRISLSSIEEEKRLSKRNEYLKRKRHSSLGGKSRQHFN